VERQAEFDLVTNLKTADALGLAPLLAHADKRSRLQTDPGAVQHIAKRSTKEQGKPHRQHRLAGRYVGVQIFLRDPA